MAKTNLNRQEENVPPFGWQIAARYDDGYVLVKRNNESAMMHHCGIYSPKMFHFCLWVGRDVRCQSCGNSMRLPDQVGADRD